MFSLFFFSQNTECNVGLELQKLALEDYSSSVNDVAV